MVHTLSTMNSDSLRIETQTLNIARAPDSLRIRKAKASSIMELPPAYTPTNRSAILHNLAACFAHQPVAHEVNPQIRRADSYPEISISADLPDDENDLVSTISLHISTRINVSSNGNLIALPSSPSDQAKSIAKAIVEAFQGCDSATGLPMIDESGRPRPVKLEVDAGMMIEGSSNVIGTESIVSEVLRQRKHSEDTANSPSNRSGESSAVTSSAPPKRRRRASDLGPIGESSMKRVRSAA